MLVRNPLYLFRQYVFLKPLRFETKLMEVLSFKDNFDLEMWAYEVCKPWARQG